MKKIILFVFLLPCSCLAQFTISGSIRNNKDNKPVANASVFLAGATVGGETDDAGSFILRNVRPGKYQLVVSAVGFDGYSEAIQIIQHNLTLSSIFLVQRAISLKTVTIKIDANRDNYVQMFSDGFLGKSDMAKQCKIVNPEVLNFDFDKNTGTLTASSDGFLIIDNNALGYKIKYLLKNFVLTNVDNNEQIHYEGSMLFQEMKGTASQNDDWKKNRTDVYANSELHFFRSVLQNRMAEEGFQAYQLAVYANPQRPPENEIEEKMILFKQKGRAFRDSLSYWKKKEKLPVVIKHLFHFPLKASEILHPSGQQDIYDFGCDNDELYITYNPSQHFRVEKNLRHLLYATNTTATIIKFTSQYALIDKNGLVANPNSMAFEGIWATNRVAEQLPSDYDPRHQSAKPQDSIVFRNVLAGLKRFSERHAEEKAFLQLNMPYYAAGDTIYFKAYVTQGGAHVLSRLSGVLHADLIDQHNKIIQSLNLELNNGLAWGEFALPDSLKSGGYRLRAYTRLMRNNGTFGFFEKAIRIQSVKDEAPAKAALVSTNSISARAITDSADIQFFPEGGTLVNNLRSKIAFKAIQTNGLGIGVKGRILDNDNNQICNFNSVHLGMGYFFLKPEKNKSYRAEIEFANGLKKTIKLPLSQPDGIILSVDEAPAGLAIHIEASKSYYRQNKDKTLTVIVHSGNEIIPIIRKLNKPDILANVSNDELQTGVTRLTLFSFNGEPLCERLMFVNKRDFLKLNLSTVRADSSGEHKITVGLHAANAKGYPVAGHFSVSVVNERIVPKPGDAANTILTNLLLTSELKGFVEQPGYYFNSSPQAADNLDILMLTQGYRRFEWKQVLDSTEKPEKVFKPEWSLEIAGILKNKSGKPVPYGKILLIIPKANISRDTVADSKGDFKFDNLNVAGMPLAVLKARDRKNKNDVYITIKQAAKPPVPGEVLPVADSLTIPSHAVSAMRKYYTENRLSSKTGTMLKEVSIKGYRLPVKPVLTNSSNLNGPGKADYILMGDQLTNCMDISCLFGKLPGTFSYDGLIFRTSGGSPKELNGQLRPPMVVIIDGMLYQQSQKPFSMININDIYSIEVLTSLSYLTIYGSNASGGALIVTMKHGGENAGSQIERTVAKGLISLPFNGFYKSREFYAPKYKYHRDSENHTDLREALYWNPELVTDQNGNTSFNYYDSENHDPAGIIVEGIDDDGNIGYAILNSK